jgi:hypothetical protein
MINVTAVSYLIADTDTSSIAAATYSGTRAVVVRAVRLNAGWQSAEWCSAVLHAPDSVDLAYG